MSPNPMILCFYRRQFLVSSWLNINWRLIFLPVATRMPIMHHAKLHNAERSTTKISKKLAIGWIFTQVEFQSFCSSSAYFEEVLARSFELLEVLLKLLTRSKKFRKLYLLKSRMRDAPICRILEYKLLDVEKSACVYADHHLAHKSFYQNLEAFCTRKVGSKDYRSNEI